MKNPTPSLASERQRSIYISGVAGKIPQIPLHPDRLEQKAKARMSRKAFAYIAGGAGLEDSVDRNRSAFNQWQILPRMLRDVSARDISIELFGQKLAGPLLLSPVGVLEMVHKSADKAVAKAAAQMGIPYIFSNQASIPMEQCAAVMGDSPRWFQLYWSKSNELVESFVQRAEKSGCSAIVVTLDTTLLGWRIQDLELASLPFLHGKGIAQYTSDPVFQRLIHEPDESGQPPPPKQISLSSIAMLLGLAWRYPGNYFKNLRGEALAGVRKFINIYSRPSLNWADLSFLRERTQIPILLKGILHADDAKKALDHGINGIIVSNHGGRQVDGSISTIEALPGVVEAVNGQIPVLLDSGVRGGADMFKALALGAKAVCIGRPYVYGLTLGGHKGVARVIENLLADFELTMALAGCSSISAIQKDCLQKG